MRYLQEAVQSWLRLAPKAILLALFAALIPTLSYAAGGENVVLEFTNSDKGYLYASLVFGAIAIGAAIYLRKQVLSSSPGSAKMQEVGLAIREGALAYLRQQVRLMLIFVVVLAIGLFLLDLNKFGPLIAALTVVSFVAGVAASYIAGYAGMLTAVDANMRTAHAALTSYKKSLEVAFRSGAVAGLVTVGMGLIGATLILLLAGSDAMKLLVGFGFGGSLAALFMRVGGGIFTKAADVGADLVGKVEAGIPEDDPRNPATIADNVGDNVGDCAGMAADVFESYEVTLVAAIILGAATAAIFDTETWTRLVLFALMARGVGILASIYGIFSVKGSDDINADPLKAIRKGFYGSAVVAAIATFALAYFMMGGQSNPIRTSILVTAEQARQKDREKIVDIRDEIAKAEKIEAWKVTPKKIQDHPKFAALGIQAEQATFKIQDALNVNPEAPVVTKLEGFSKLDFGGKNPVLGYAAIIPQEEARQLDVDKDVVSVKQAYQNAKIVVAEVEETTTTPGAPAQRGEPAQPEKKNVRTVAFGPTTQQILDQNFKREIPGVTYKVLETHPVELHANPEGQLAFVVKDTITNFGDLQQIGGVFPFFFRIAPDELRTLIKENRDAAPGTEQKPMPTQENIKTAQSEGQAVPWYLFATAIVFGLFMAFAIEYLTDYYVSTHKKPTQEVAGVSSTGPATMIIQGFAYALESSVFLVFAIVLALIMPLFLFNPALYGGYLLSFYGIALVGLGLLTTTGYVLAMDTFGPISDNAQGVFEMSGENHDNEYGNKAVSRLDAAGNTTKALTKGFAIATAVVAAVALFHTYLESARLGTMGLRLDIPEIFLGLMIGGAAPYLFSAATISSVGRAAFELINEVRRQFRADAGIMAGTSKPDYARCVAIVTAAAQKELLGPGILAIALPVAVAFGFSIGSEPTKIGDAFYNLKGAQALGGFLAGTIVSGQLMAVLLANAGGMWDNAKKIIEDGLYGGKGSEAHKAAVVCDTVGDPFKDTAGPALNPLIKVMNLVALLLAPTVIMPFEDSTLIIITLCAVGALAFSIWNSKRTSVTDEMSKIAVQNEGTDAAVLTGDTAPKVAKKKITVDDDEA